MSGITLGVGISPTDGINSGAAGINSGAAGLAGSVGAGPAPPVTPTFYQRQLPAGVFLDADNASTYQAQAFDGIFVDGR